jgi:hypothetical protein
MKACLLRREEFWVEKHKEWLATVPGSKHIVVEKAPHFIQAATTALVIEAIKQVSKRAAITIVSSPSVARRAAQHRPSNIEKIFSTTCRIPVSPFVVIVKAGN